MRISEVSRLKQRKGRPRPVELTGSVLLALATAELAARLLTPRASVPIAAPAAPETYFTAEEIRRGRRFVRPQMALGLARGALDRAALGALVGWGNTRGGRRVVRRRRRGMGAGPAGHPVAVASLAAGGMAAVAPLPALPLAVLARRRAVAVGLVTQSWSGWLVDLAKETLIGAGLSAGAGGVVTALARRYPRGWWAPAAAGAAVAGAGLAMIAPAVLDPLFNDFEPLEPGQTRDDVLKVASAAGVKVGEVYRVDASRRTTAANAYVTGLGPTKRVVLFDTLLDRYGRDEIRLVVAHELAHVRHRDVPRGVTFGALVAPAGALAIQRLSWAMSPARGTAEALPALALSAAAVSTPIRLIANRVSRAIERRADHSSLELTGAPEAFISFERGVTLQNVADPKPPAWVSKLLATHPSTAERIGAAVAFADGSGGQAPSA